MFLSILKFIYIVTKKKKHRQKEYQKETSHTELQLKRSVAKLKL